MAKSARLGYRYRTVCVESARCRPHETDAHRIVVEAFDYVEYPKLLSQPDADSEELVREAIETFLSRNEMKGDRIAIAVPGQSGLARFIKLPPVEAKKIPDIVKYEARQQIPFALEDVVWDYEPLAGGSQDEGFALETEIGLFAMKRDQVSRALEPLMKAGVEVDQIQLAPLSVYNFACFDQLGELNDEEFNPTAQPDSTVVLSIGVDTTDLVVTNGYRVWQRNIPIGGSHFTKALTKELKLTFSKAEHLKKNATKAEDPKAVFQAMRPVFSDLVAELQRSIGFFNSNNRDAKLSRVLTIGNAMKMPGLQRYLAQNLEIPVESIDEFNNLVGGSVTATPAFEQNRLSFPVAYGLCVQALGLSRISTNLIPEEIVTQRMIKAKKPWAVAAAAMLMIGMVVNYSSYVGAWQTVQVDDDWKSPISQSQSMASKASQFESANSELKDQFETIVDISDNLQSNVDGRALWLELIKATTSALPRDERPMEERQRTAEDVTSRTELHISSMDCQEYEDLSTWFANVQSFYTDAQLTATERAAEKAAAEKAAAAAEAAANGEPIVEEPVGEELAEEEFDPAMEEEIGIEGEETTGGAGPTGKGWVIQLTGHHFHNTRGNEGEQFVRSTFIKELENGSIKLPDGPNGEMMDVTFKELGIDYPVVVTNNRILSVVYDPEAVGEEGATGGRARTPGRMARPMLGGGAGEEGAIEEPEVWKLRRYDFMLQFSWVPTPKNQRQEARKEGSTEDDFEADL